MDHPWQVSLTICVIETLSYFPPCGHSLRPRVCRYSWMRK